jgi:hypothetical protein
LAGIVLPELQRFYGRAIVIITPVEMPISDINRPLSIIIFILYLLRMNWSNIEKWRKLLKIGTIVLSSILKYCAKFKKN